MNILESTEIVAEVSKVYIIRLQNGSLIGTQIAGSDDESNLIFLDNPCFMNISGSNSEIIKLEPFVPASLVTHRNGAMNMNHILMMWPASDTFSAYYTSVIMKYALDLIAKSDKPAVVEKKKPAKKEETETSNVIDFVNFRKSKEEKQAAKIVTPVEPQDPDVA